MTSVTNQNCLVSSLPMPLELGNFIDAAIYTLGGGGHGGGDGLRDGVGNL